MGKNGCNIMLNDYTGPFIAFCFLAAFFYIAVNAFRNKRALKVRLDWRWRIIIFAIVLLVIREIPARIKTHHLSTQTLPALPVGILADAIALAGLIVVVWARTVLGGNWSPFVEIKENHELIRTGPYKYVRHPMYSGLILIMLGTAIWVNHPVIWLIFLASIFGFLFKAQREEKLLAEHFKEEYNDYRNKTKALIPFIL